MTLVFDCVSCAGCGCVLTVLAYLRTCLLELETATTHCAVLGYTALCVMPSGSAHMAYIPAPPGPAPGAYIFAPAQPEPRYVLRYIFASGVLISQLVEDGLGRSARGSPFLLLCRSSSIPRRSLASHISRSPETSPPFVMVSAANGAASDEAEVCCCAAGEVRRAAAQGLHGPVTSVRLSPVGRF